MRAPNTDCVIYFAGNAPPAAPDVSNVRGGLYDHFRQGMEVSENPTHAHRYTATLDVPLDTDLRDGYPGADEYRVYVPDQDGQGYRVVFVERIRHFRGQNFKRVYLDKLPLTTIQCGTFGLPHTLYATIPLGTGCPCLDGISIPIVFDGIEAAYLEAYIALNPLHDQPEWGLIGRHLYGRLLEAIAERLLARGIKLPCNSTSPSNTKPSKRRASSKSEVSLTLSPASTTNSAGPSLFR